jgi:hypothetical protein
MPSARRRERLQRQRRLAGCVMGARDIKGAALVRAVPSTTVRADWWQWAQALPRERMELRRRSLAVAYVRKQGVPRAQSPPGGREHVGLPTGTRSAVGPRSRRRWCVGFARARVRFATSAAFVVTGRRGCAETTERTHAHHAVWSERTDRGEAARSLSLPFSLARSLSARQNLNAVRRQRRERSRLREARE